jgi:hypothetical protein
MPSVFLSYARADAPTVQTLAQALQAQGIAVWRDQDSLYGGERWPKAIGEAIAAHDWLLLAWSQQAARSHFVEFEWTTAIALRKMIIPCLMDETPLPPTLSAINAIDVRQIDAALPKILHALHRSPAPTDPTHSAEVMAKLEALTPAEPEAVAQAARAVFTQQGWNVQGNVYQAAGDIHVTIAQPEANPKKSLVERWQTWVALFIGILAMTTLAVDLPGKIQKLIGPSEPGVQAVEQSLSGVIWDEGHEPLPGVEVVLPEFNLTTTTDRHGAFALRVKADKQRTIDVIARKDGYLTHDSDATLGNTSLNFTMRRKP